MPDLVSPYQCPISGAPVVEWTNPYSHVLPKSSTNPSQESVIVLGWGV